MWAGTGADVLVCSRGIGCGLGAWLVKTGMVWVGRRSCEVDTPRLNCLSGPEDDAAHTETQTRYTASMHWTRKRQG
jgi:hypothetical protein